MTSDSEKAREIAGKHTARFFHDQRTQMVRIQDYVLAAVVEAIDSQRRTITELQATIAEKDAEIARLKEIVENKNTSISMAHSRIYAKHAIIEQLQSELTASREECERLTDLVYAMDRASLDNFGVTITSIIN